jgi:hypothetical protein
MLSRRELVKSANFLFALLTREHAVSEMAATICDKRPCSSRPHTDFPNARVQIANNYNVSDAVGFRAKAAKSSWRRTRICKSPAGPFDRVIASFPTHDGWAPPFHKSQFLRIALNFPFH